MQMVRRVMQFVKPASKAAAQSIIGNTGNYYISGTIGGGKKFKNREGRLPSGLTYREYDVNPYNGSERDAERLVRADDGRVWYTDDHYSSFTLIG
ncbi:MAG: ribonuclease domain-containing protein [Bacteroidota bacterium]